LGRAGCDDWLEHHKHRCSYHHLHHHNCGSVFLGCIYSKSTHDEAITFAYGNSHDGETNIQAHNITSDSRPDDACAHRKAHDGFTDACADAHGHVSHIPPNTLDGNFSTKQYVSAYNNPSSDHVADSCAIDAQSDA